MEEKRSYLPYFVMAVTAVMYVIKWLTKTTVGDWVGSPALAADGYHNLADLIEVGLVVVFGVYVGGRPRSEKYPMGMKRIESVLVLGIGLALLLLVFETVTVSVSGLISLWPALDSSVRPHMPAWLYPAIKQ